MSIYGVRLCRDAFTGFEVSGGTKRVRYNDHHDHHVDEMKVDCDMKRHRLVLSFYLLSLYCMAVTGIFTPV